MTRCRWSRSEYAVLGAEVRDLRVPVREGVALVVVVGLVPGERVEGLELEVVRVALHEAERDAVVDAVPRRLEGGELPRGRSCPPFAPEARRPRRAEQRVVAVDPAPDVDRVRVGVPERDRDVLRDLALDGGVELVRARVLVVLVPDVDLRVVRESPGAWRDSGCSGRRAPRRSRQGAVAHR